MTYIRANGVVLNIKLRGSGEPVVLIPDVGEDLDMWDMQMGPFSREHFTMAIDNRGSGWSDSPTCCSIEEMANDIVCLMDLVGIDKAHLVGHGMGGMIALELASRRPGRVDGLVLASTASMTPLQREVYEKWASAGREGRDLEKMYSTMVDWLFSPRFLTDERRREHVIRVKSARAKWISWDAVNAHIASMRSFDPEKRLPGVRAPTLVVSGSADLLCPPESSRGLAGAIEGSKRATLDAGHLLNQEAYRSFNDLALAFMAEVDRTRRTGPSYA
jgi:pimeloyl-ACP methyl ester carboxylesterase